MARTFYADNLAMLRRLDASDFTRVESYDPGGDDYESCFLGTVFALDPCGRYHHAMLSPNGLTARCVAYWESLEKAAERLDMWIENGEGDPCDVFVCRSLPEREDDDADAEDDAAPEGWDVADTSHD